MTRSRWLAARLALAGGVLIAVAAVAAWLLTWWWERFDQLQISSRAVLERGSLVPVATAVLAFTVATAAGALTRRSCAPWPPAWSPPWSWPLPSTWPPRPGSPTAAHHRLPAGQPSPRAALNDQVVSGGYRDRTGRDLPAQAVDQLCPGTAGQRAVDRCLAANRIQRGLLGWPHPRIQERPRPRDILALPQLPRVAGALVGGQNRLDHGPVSPDRRGGGEGQT